MENYQPNLSIEIFLSGRALFYFKETLIKIMFKDFFHFILHRFYHNH